MSSAPNPPSRGTLQPIHAPRMARRPRWPILALALVIGIGLGIFLPERPVEHRVTLPQAQIALPPATPEIKPQAPAPRTPIPAPPPVSESVPREVPPADEAAPAAPLPEATAPARDRSRAEAEAPSGVPAVPASPPSLPLEQGDSEPPALPEPQPEAPLTEPPAAPSAQADSGTVSPPREKVVPPPVAPSEHADGGPAAPPRDKVVPPPAAPLEQADGGPAASPQDKASPPPGDREEQRAALPPGAPASEPEQPAWRRYAVSSPAADGRAMVAVIIDDMGLDVRRSRVAMDLPGPLTLAFIPYANDLDRQTAAARKFGHELMVHVSMQPLNAAIDAGPNALTVDLDEAEIRRRLVWALNSFDGYVGINNHMGSRFTTYRPGLTVVMEELKKRGLLFLDSRTVPHSLGLPIAAEFGVPHVGRSLFIDNVLTLDAVNKELAEIEQIAQRSRVALAIGHPHDATLAALKEWLPTLAAKGMVLVPVSAIVARQEARRAAAQAKTSASPQH